MLCKAHKQGQGLVEYAFILLLVALAVLAALILLGPVIGNAFTKLNSSLNSS
jgi:pilus assembly protein Flp/PilA